MDHSIYNAEFYRGSDRTTDGGAHHVLSILFDVMPIRSVIDVGCGLGNWLKNAKILAGKIGWPIEVRGLDGDHVMKECNPEISPEEFTVCDLNERIKSDRRYDLAISLEVAEHLKPERAVSFVEDLTALSDVVLFSAAIPHQEYEPSAHGHINERPLSYWEKIFNDRGYRLIDCIRPNIWTNERVGWFYRQNIVVFVRENSKNLKRLETIPRPHITDIVNPVQFQAYLWLTAHLNEQLKKAANERVIKIYQAPVPPPGDQGFVVSYKDYSFVVDKNLPPEMIVRILETIKRL